MLQLYITTGCDYISFVSGVGKSMFMNYLFQYAEFIGGASSFGSLSQTQPGEIKAGFLSLIRLMGTAYFKKNLATMVSKFGCETPTQLLNSIDSQLSQDRKWYTRIRGVVKVLSEEHRPPTVETLDEVMLDERNVEKFYFKRPIQRATESHSWLKIDVIDWEAEEVKKNIKETLDFLSKGCTCKTGCKTKRCSCKKNERQCGASCECHSCTNVLLHSNECDAGS